MTAMKIIHNLFPSALHHDVPRTKRRKTQSSPYSGMEVETGGERQHFRNRSDESLNMAPSFLVSRTLAEQGLPDRRDPFSMDYFMEFDYNDGECHYDIPSEIMMAIQYGNANQLIQYYLSRDRVAAQRNSQGESLLHLACRWGSVTIIKLLVGDLRLSTFVLDKQGRSPLHSLCLAMNTGSMTGIANAQNCNHFESMRLLLKARPTLILYKDKNGKVPLEYLQQVTGAIYNPNPIWKTVNEILFSEQTIKIMAGEMLQDIEISRSGQRMSAWEKINSMLDLSGLDSAIMETGLSV